MFKLKKLAIALTLSVAAITSAHANTFTISSTERLFNSGLFLESIDISITQASTVSYTFSNIVGTYSLFVPALSTATVPATTFTSGSLLNPGNYTFNVFGNLVSSSGSFKYTLTAVTAPVPEPESSALMFLGLGLIGMIARRKYA